MTGLLHLWWIWLAASLLLALVELAVPGTIFLGFALGALAMIPLVLIWPAMPVAALLALFAGLSLLAWIVLRRVFRTQSSGARIVTRDVNDD